MHVDNPWVYLSKRVLHSSTDECDNNPHISSFAVCEQHDMVAVATYDGIVTVYFNNDPNMMKNESTFSTKLLAKDDESYCTQLSWQDKSRNLLVAGTTNGQITYMDVMPSKKYTTHESSAEMALLDLNKEIHDNEIINFTWNSNNDEESMHLLSVDKSGCCSLWKAELNVALIPLIKYHNDSQVHRIIFLDSILPSDKQNNNFLFALDNGQVYQADALGRCNEIEMNNCGEPIEFLQCYVEKSIVLVITRSMMLIQLTVVDGLMVSTRNAKLSIELNFDNDVLLAPFGHLICMSTKGTLQCFDLVTDENYELKVPPADVNGNLDKVISFASSGHILAACSQDGKCIFWKYDDSLKKWIVIAIKSIGSHNDTASLLCTFTKNTLVLKAELGFTALFVEYCHSANADEIIALQTGSTTVAIFNDENQGAFAVLDTGMKVNGIAMDSKYICIWSDDEIHVYNIDGCRRCELHSEISMRAHSVAINASSLFIAKDQSLLITDMYGVQRLTISIPSSEGQLLHLDASYDQLAVVTRLGTIKTMDITQKEPKLLTVGKSVFENNFHNFDQVLSVKCNPDGTILSLLSESIIGTHQLHFFETKTGTVKSLEAIIENDSLIMSHCWDPVFPKLFACEVRSRDQKMNRIYTLFVSEELEIYVHEDVHISGSSRLMSVNAPSKLLLLRGEGSTISPESSINGEVLHKSLIKGLSDVDVTNTSSLSALVDFIFYLNANDLDKAHLCIQSMRSTEMWNKLARVCVTQNRLDIAQRCLAKMGNGLGVAAVRRADKEAALAEVAIQLGMVSDAERLYKECNRLDLLCNLYRRQGLWKEAIDTCHEGCIEGKSLQSQYTKQLERNYHPDKLLSNHKKSLKSRKKIIKDLYLKGESVESFLQQENDIELLKWYASYVEGNGDIDMAKELYKMANDDLSLIRIACLQGNLNDAFTLVRESNIPVGAYHLARHLEANGDIKGAISCFARCGKYNYAIRLSKTFGIDNEIMNFALQSEKPQRIECAHYLASIGQNENAAELYMKAGDNQKALDIILQLPLEHGSAKLQVDVLGIIDGLEMETSEDVIRQCATLLLRSGCSKKAIQLLQRKGYTTDGILQFSRENEMVLTESIINEILSPYEEKMCKTQLRSIAAICKAQGNHILACKKFTEGGDRSSAMKCLLLTGDTKNIISYAFTSRTKEVYIIAANYLQTLDYYHDEDMKKTLLQMYSKGKSNEHLVRLMSSWSSFEAADGQYDIAMKWLHEAKKFGIKWNAWDGSNEQRWIMKNIDSIELFLSAQNIASTNQLKANEICVQLLNDHKSEDLIQMGDCYALLVQIENDSGQALKIIEEMIERGLSPVEYIEEDAIAIIYKAEGRNPLRFNDDSQESNESNEDHMLL